MAEQSLVATQPCESLEMQQLANEVGDVLCIKCQYPVDMMDLSARTHANRVVCKNCHNVETMLRKHLVQLPQQWDLMNPQEQTSFFQSCLKLKDESGVLLQSCAQRVEERFGHQVDGDLFPRCQGRVPADFLLGQARL